MSEPTAADTAPLPREELARRAGVSSEAVALLRACEVVDLHLDAFIPARLLGRDLRRRGGTGPLGGRFFGHLDVPRALDGGLTGAMWSITTNVARGARGRLEALRRNVERLLALFASTDGAVQCVRTAAAYRAARARGSHAAMIAVQGGNAFEAAADGPAAVPGDWIVRVTLVHLTSSVYGSTSSPAAALAGRRRGLTERGRVFVRQLDEARVFVDLAHADARTFWDVVEVHDRELPLICTHTGVRGVREHWRNLDDAQLRAVAESGGVIGVMFHGAFLSRRGGPKDVRMVVEHLEHVIRVAGEQAAAIGSDYDGCIVPPPDLRDGAVGYARLVQAMLEAGWREERIRRVLGGNFLACFERMRPG
ncbi:MAG: membrane dipeptidase [Myxococcales bacterium]|nr:membrane dipeptidase [Myxococcales bacterium]